MELESIKLVNFRCFRDSGIIPIHKFSIFIGENDCGKSSLLEAIRLVLQNQTPGIDAFHKINETESVMISIELSFILNAHEKNVIHKQHYFGNIFKIKKNYTRESDKSISQKIFVEGTFFIDVGLNNIDELKRDPLIELCKKYSLTQGTVDDMKKQLHEYVDKNISTISSKKDWIEIKWQVISDVLPVFEYYNSNSFDNPTKIIENTLKSIYRKNFYDVDGNGLESLKTSLEIQRKMIETELNDEIGNKLLGKIQSINKKVKGVEGDFIIDFAAGFHLNTILIDFGTGLNPIGGVGDGSKTRLFLAISEWDKEIRAQGYYKNVIRAYDEPDASLHYNAQKEMYYLLEGIAKQKNGTIQVLICTHSISMIDRAPPTIINQIIQKDGCSTVSYLLGTEDEEIKNYLDGISGLSGISNSSLFFERCFLIVEGETEEASLPLFYYKMTGKKMVEDGIVIVNIRSNACWDTFLKLLSKNKEKATILFLDSDIQDTNKKLNLKNIQYTGFNAQFILDKVIFAGIKEFEDEFPNDLTTMCLNSKWPKNDGTKWDESEIASMKEEKKYSAVLTRRVRDCSKNDFSKPKFMMAMAETMTTDQMSKVKCLGKMIVISEKIIN